MYIKEFMKFQFQFVDGSVFNINLKSLIDYEASLADIDVTSIDYFEISDYFKNLNRTSLQNYIKSIPWMELKTLMEYETHDEAVSDISEWIDEAVENMKVINE